MSAWTWALMALSDQCGSELVGIDLVHGTFGKNWPQEKPVPASEIALPEMAYEDDPVLKVTYQVQPG